MNLLVNMRLKIAEVSIAKIVIQGKIRYFLFVLFCCFLINSYSQTSSVWINKCFKEYKIKEHKVLTLNFDGNTCNQIYVAVDSMNRSFVFNACKQKIELDTFFKRNSKSDIIIGVNNSFHYILYNKIINSFYKPILIEKNKFDSLLYLDFGNFIGYKGTEKWILDIDKIQNDVNNYQKINFIGSQFFVFKGGLIVPTKLNNKVKFRYIQHTNTVSGYDDNNEQLNDPNFKYLQPDMKFEADSILIYPTSSQTALIKNNGILQIYSFCKDTIIESEIEKYYESPIERYPIIITKSHVSYGGCEWRKLAIKNVKSIEFEVEGDFLYGLAKTKTNEIYKIDFFENTFSKK